MAPTLANPALVAMYGPISSLGIDSIATLKSVLLGGVFLALLAYVVVRRHTRTEEEAGRLELLGAGVVGRRAALTAAVLLGTAAVLLTVVLTVVWSIAVGLDRRRLGRPRCLLARHGAVVGRRHRGRRPADLEHPWHGCVVARRAGRRLPRPGRG